MAFTDTFKNELLNAAFRGQTYTGGTIQVALFKTGLPSGGGTEATGSGYSRQTMTFSPASGGSISLTANVVFTDLNTSETYVAYGIYDGTDLIDEAALTSPFTPDLSNNELEVSYTASL